SDSVDYVETPTVNGSLQGYRSLPRGVILSSMRDPIIKSSSLMSVPPSSARTRDSEAATSRRERRGSLETLLNQSKATENLTEDSGSFFRRYGGSKRGVFLRWAQDRTCGYKTTDHMLQTQGPDWQKVLLYVESIYQKFEA
ncbi:unnamed protein product, partial [Ranitomeya imitator]